MKDFLLLKLYYSHFSSIKSKSIWKMARQEKKEIALNQPQASCCSYKKLCHYKNGEKIDVEKTVGKNLDMTIS